MGNVRTTIAGWREELRSEAYVSPSRVQDRLFTLWSDLQGTPGATLVERWLTLTLERQLFSGAELVEFLDELEAYLELHSGTRTTTQA